MGDVIVAFTSPRCGYCKALEPVLEKLSEILKNKSVPIKIGNYNIMENEEQSDYPVTGVPTMYFIKKGTSAPVKISDNARSLQEFLKFLSESGSSAKINLADYQEYMAEEKAVSEQEEEILSEKLEEVRKEK